MSPITQEKKQAVVTSKSELANLQKHGMSADSMMGRDEIQSLVGEKGKGPVGKMQSFVRGIAKGFFSRAGEPAKKDASKK